MKVIALAILSVSAADAIDDIDSGAEKTTRHFGLLRGNSGGSHREAIVVGKNDCPPGQADCLPRGYDYVLCADALDSDGQKLFRGKSNPCGGKDADDAEVECLWYAGFTEYYCECIGEDLTYCQDPANAFCLDGYAFTKIFPNGGRSFWNCNVV